MHSRRCLASIPRAVAACSLLVFGAACSEGASSPGNKTENGGDGSGAVGGAAGSHAVAGAGAGGATSSGGTNANTGGTSNSGGTTSGMGGGTSSGGTTTSGAGGVTSGAGGATSGTGGAMSGAGGMTAGAGGALAGSGGGAGEAGSATGGLAGSGGGASGASGAGGAPTSTRSPGCGTPLDRPDRKVQQTMEIDGTTRYYLLNVPDTDNETPLALVFALHGYDMNNVALVDLYDFTSRSNGRAITVLPQGEGPPPGDVSHWGDGVLESRWTANETNYTYIETLKADLESRYCIDPSRVFITGFSMGGFFTNSLACAHNDWFRGYAPVAGGGPESCANADAKPAVIIHHGTADDIVAPESGENTRDFWVGHNGCSAMTTSSFTGCQTYSGCPDGRPVVYCVGNWNHTVSGTAAANIWSFFDGLE